MYSFGFDISTTTIGWSIFNFEDGAWKYCISGYLKLNKQFSTLQKAEQFADLLSDLQHATGTPSRCVVEAPKQVFGSGKSNANTMATLQGFNAICRYIIYKEYNIQPEMISEATARKGLISRSSNKSQKEQAGEYVMNQKWFPKEKIQRKRTGKIKDEVLDETDAVLINMAYCREVK